jgi:hypothetical protein
VTVLVAGAQRSSNAIPFEHTMMALPVTPSVRGSWDEEEVEWGKWKRTMLKEHYTSALQCPTHSHTITRLPECFCGSL